MDMGNTQLMARLRNYLSFRWYRHSDSHTIV